MNFTVYDRNQYEKGFIDGCKNYTVAFRAELAKEIFEEIETLIKNNCLTITDDRGIKSIERCR